MVRKMGKEEGMVVHMEKERMGCVGRANLRKRRTDIGNYFE